MTTNELARPEDVGERFWAKVLKTETCWLWTGARLVAGGYGCIKIGGRAGTSYRAHRLSWELANGPIPNGLLVLHRCDHPPCVNPDHLFLGTHEDNTHDMHSKDRGFVPPAMIGDQHPLAKVSESIVMEIRRLYAEGTPAPKLGRIYGISACHAWSIATGRAWKHLPVNAQVSA